MNDRSFNVVTTTLAVVVVVVTLIPIAVHAAVPEQINYPGRLLDRTNLVTDTKTIIFKLYNTDTDGVALAPIQALHKRNKALMIRNTDLEKRLADMEDRLGAIERRIME